jgi:hypothetical protein
MLPATCLPPSARGVSAHQIEGYNLQAATRLAANDRDGLENLCSYFASCARRLIAPHGLAHYRKALLGLGIEGEPQWSAVAAPLDRYQDALCRATVKMTP